jgi:predicted secreted protein
MRTRWGAAVIALAIAAGCTREAAPPTKMEDASVAVSAKADADVDADADVKADASADADADVKADADAGRAKADAEAADSGTTTGTTTTTKTVSLDEASDGKTVDVARGQTLVLMLGANPTSGFDWAVRKAPAALGAPAMGFVSGGDQMGAPGKRRIVWTVKDTLPAGEHAVELGYARSFEPGVAPFKTFRFKVRAAR